MNTQDIYKDIVKCIQSAWVDEMVFDFTVKLQDKTVQCHRFMLASCSDFFKGLFRSGMKEITDNCVVLKGVSCDVFTLILRTIYTGENVLNVDNFIDVWRAVDMLQINFMINLCETFAIQSLAIDTWENIYMNAKILDSKKVLNELHLFMLKNFETICLSRTFLQMPFKEIYALIESQDLVVNNEDLVLESVMKWVEYVPKRDFVQNDGTSRPLHEDSKQNKSMKIDSEHFRDFLDVFIGEDSARKDKLPELLKQVRTCLVSPTVLSRVLQLELFENSRDIIDYALNYHGQEFKHGHLPSAAIQRSCSGYTYGGVIASRDGRVAFLDEQDDNIFIVGDGNYFQEIFQLVSFNGELYAVGKSNEQVDELCRLFVFRGNKWEYVADMPSHNLFLVSRDEFIYISNKDDHKIYRINPKEDLRNVDNFTELPAPLNISHTMGFEHFLLVFGSEAGTSIDETAVYQLDISSKVWTRLDNIEGPAEQLISFSTDKYQYILQTNGSISLVMNSSEREKVEFRYLVKLSNENIHIHGAFTYKSKLKFLGNFQPNVLCRAILQRDGLPDLETFRSWVITDIDLCNLVPISLPTNYLDVINKNSSKRNICNNRNPRI
ncbi:kelch-like protein 9 [Physella acuta]|uniref:kelch-like protein 9 n=1 Tax=Physella acuta TaxID=109671 RepID=UPI0027DC877D|nr:kelch-like protein 9 [Physella acuta]